MQQKRVSKKQQLQYILECRNSGLTDYQWCKEHGIHPGTFYNWVSKLKKSGVKDIPDPISRLDHKPINQEVVKLDVVSDNLTQDNLSVKMEQNACLHSEPSKDSIIEIVLPNATIRFINNTDARHKVSGQHEQIVNNSMKYGIDIIDLSYSQ